MIYAMSDIHGCIGDLRNRMKQVDLSGENRIVFLGDYADYGDSSYQVLKYIWDLQKKYGEEKVVVLKGNHEQMFLEWIEDSKNPYSDGSEDYMTFNDWLRSEHLAMTAPKRNMRKIFQMKRVMMNMDHGQPLFITSVACMSRSMSGMGSELIGGTLKPKYHSDSAGRRGVLWNRKQNRIIRIRKTTLPSSTVLRL